MGSKSLPAPRNPVISIVKTVLEKLIEGLGVDAAIAAATFKAPFLRLPVVKQFFRFLVEQIAEEIDANMFKFAAKMIIRIQNEGRKSEFDEAMKPFNKPEGPSADEIQKAKDAIDRIVRRSR